MILFIKRGHKYERLQKERARWLKQTFYFELPYITLQNPIFVKQAFCCDPSW